MDGFLFELTLYFGENRRLKAPPQEVFRESSSVSGSVSTRGLVELREAVIAAGRGRIVEGPVKESASPTDNSEGGDGEDSGAVKLDHMKR